MEKKSAVVGLILLTALVILSNGFKSINVFLMTTAHLLGSFVLCWAVYHGIRYTGLTKSKKMTSQKRTAQLALITSGLLLVGSTFIFETGSTLIVYIVWLAFLYWHELHSLVLREKEVATK